MTDSLRNLAVNFPVFAIRPSIKFSALIKHRIQISNQVQDSDSRDQSLILNLSELNTSVFSFKIIS